MDNVKTAGGQSLYDEDFAAWSKQQAEALRVAARSEIVLDGSPSLRREIGGIVETELARASRRAIQDLRAHGEVDRAGTPKIHATRYTEEQVLGDWFPPAPPEAGARCR